MPRDAASREERDVRVLFGTMNHRNARRGHRLGERLTGATDGDPDGRDGERLGDRGDTLSDAPRPEARHDAAGLGEGLEDPGVDRSHEPDAR